VPGVPDAAVGESKPGGAVGEVSDVFDDASGAGAVAGGAGAGGGGSWRGRWSIGAGIQLGAA
jgi:hypothetical protein